VRRLSTWRIAVGASTLLVAAALATLAVLWATSLGTRSTSYTARAPGALVRLEVVVEHGDVEIVGGGPVEVIVERTETRAFGHEPVERRTIQGDVLRIESTCPALVVGTCRADYRITMPEDVAVTVSAAHGDVRVNAFRAVADLSTRGGDVDVDAFCGRLLHATARGGDVDVQASCTTERLEARTDSGAVRISVPRGTYSVDADSNGGTVEVFGLTQARSASAQIQALSDSGDVTVDGGP
jgi:hypothetical protein